MIASVEDLEVDMLTCLQTLELRGNKLHTTSGINVPSLRNLFLVGVDKLVRQIDPLLMLSSSCIGLLVNTAFIEKVSGARGQE